MAIIKKDQQSQTEELKITNYTRSLIEASLDPLVTISFDGKILDVNEASVKVIGVPREKLIGTDFSNYFTEPEKAQVGYKQVFEKGFVSNYPLTIKHVNGNLTDVLYNASVYKDDKGNVLGVFAAARDVTEQKLAKDLRTANKELAFQNEEKEKRAAELAIANKELIFQNREKEKRADELFIANKELAYQNEEKEKRAAELAIANKELAFQNEEKEKRAAELIVANKELIFQNREKEKRADELFIANKELAFQNEEKEKRAAELIIANKELAFQNEEKEKRAAELAIANKELVFQNQEKEKRVEELKQLDKLKDSFLFTTTHELKTPLVPIKAQAQLLLKGLYGEINEKQKNAIKVISRNVDSLSRLSGDIFDFAKIKSGALIIHAEETSLEEVLNDTMKDMEIVSEEKKVALSLSPLPLLPKINIDKGRIKQVLNNLLDNAFKFTPEGGRIDIIVERLGDDIKIIIKDSGIGISKENQEKLFTPFLQIDSSLSRKFSGTGLGLVVSKGIIEAHNGKIFAESEGEGKGSTFIFTLPIKMVIK